MNDIANLRYCGQENTCENVALNKTHFEKLPKLPDISPIITCLNLVHCDFWLPLLLLLIPISIGLGCFMKCHVLPFIGELGGSSSRDMDSTIMPLKEIPEENPIEQPQPRDVEASNLDCAPVGSTQARNMRESGAVCSDDGQLVETRVVSEPEVNDCEIPS